MTFAVAQTHNFGRKPIFIFVDHASNRVPPEFNDLGLENAELSQHIGWDIGAKALALIVAETLDATAVSCSFSRLLIDPNRALDNPALIPETSDGIVIPGNLGLSPHDREHRVTTYYKPYHDHLRRTLDEVQAAHSDPLIVSVHSFTPELADKAEDRPWHIGMLWKDDEKTARRIMEILRTETNYVIGDNEPYSGEMYNFTVDKHVGPRRVRHATFEVRQDVISDPVGISEMARIIASALSKLV